MSIQYFWVKREDVGYTSTTNTTNLNFHVRDRGSDARNVSHPRDSQIHDFAKSKLLDENVVLVFLDLESASRRGANGKKK